MKTVGPLTHVYKRRKRRYKGGRESDGLNIRKPTDRSIWQENSVRGEREGQNEMYTWQPMNEGNDSVMMGVLGGGYMGGVGDADWVSENYNWSLGDLGLERIVQYPPWCWFLLFFSLSLLLFFPIFQCFWFTRGLPPMCGAYSIFPVEYIQHFLVSIKYICNN